MKKYLRCNKETYNQLSEEYKDRRDHKSEFEEDLDVLGGTVLGYVKTEDTKERDLNVLEIGPGAGQMLRYFESHRCKTIGVELSEKMAEYAKVYSPQSIIINDDVNNVNFLDCQMDIVYIGATIHLFPHEDAVSVMNKVFGWLKEGGVLFINTTIHKNTYEGYFRKDDYKEKGERYRFYWTELDFEKFVISKGFKILERIYTDEVDRKKKWLAFVCKKEGCYV